MVKSPFSRNSSRSQFSFPNSGLGTVVLETLFPRADAKRSFESPVPKPQFGNEKTHLREGVPSPAKDHVGAGGEQAVSILERAGFEVVVVAQLRADDDVRPRPKGQTCRQRRVQPLEA